MASSLQMLSPYLMSKVMIGLTSFNSAMMVKYSLILLLLTMFCQLLCFLWDNIAGILDNNVACEIKKDIVNSYLDTKYLNSKDESSGYYLERLNDDTTEVSAFFSNVAARFVDLFANVGYMIYIFVLNWQCGLLFAIGIICLYMIDLITLKKDLKFLDLIKNYSQKSNSKINEAIRGMKDIKGLGIKSYINKENVEINQKLASAKTRRIITSHMLPRVKTCFTAIIDCILVITCALWLFPSGKIDLIVILIIINYKTNIYNMVGFFAKIKGYLVQGEYQAGRIFEIINNSNKEMFGTKVIHQKTCGIKIENLDFTYPDGKKILNAISMTVKPNTCTVLVGSSGSGKSTLFNIISKLMEIEKGKVYFNDFDINELSEQSFRDTICLVSQEPFMFNDTIENNIKIVKPTATQKEMEDACIKANIHNEILSFKYGYETFVSENGTNLSGGQKQRIALARALLKNTPIILFDEPTSALDKDNQTKFLETLGNLKQEKTIFVIAHKLLNYNIFDNVFEIKHGVLKKLDIHN
jgi:ABC-type multidrug transport system fused ATPase/permease subunit